MNSASILNKFIAGIFLLFLGACSSPKNYRDQLNAEHLLKVDLDMSYAEVTTLIGEPYEWMVEGDTTLIGVYTEKLEGSNYPMVWIHYFSDDTTVYDVYVKYYELLDDPGIYSLEMHDGKRYQTDGAALRQFLP